MKGWWLPWLFPVLLLGVVVLFAVFGDYAIFVSFGLALVAVPLVLRAYAPTDDPDADVNYWRLGGPVRRP